MFRPHGYFATVACPDHGKQGGCPRNPCPFSHVLSSQPPPSEAVALLATLISSPPASHNHAVDSVEGAKSAGTARKRPAEGTSQTTKETQPPSKVQKLEVASKPKVPQATGQTSKPPAGIQMTAVSNYAHLTAR